jgi:hypothetical protein
MIGYVTLGCRVVGETGLARIWRDQALGSEREFELHRESPGGISRPKLRQVV